VYVQALLHHIYMESLGRDVWRESKRRKLAPLGPPTEQELQREKLAREREGKR